MHTEEIKSGWKMHTPNLLKEIVNCSGNAIYKIPLNMLGRMLADVGERAAELNDPILNSLMLQLTIYTVADPGSPDYEPQAVEDGITLIRVWKRAKQETPP